MGRIRGQSWLSRVVAGLSGLLMLWTQTHGAELDFAAARRAMVREQLAAPARDITNRLVLEVMARVPRHEFVPADERKNAYRDHPLPIGHGQTISQPYIVAFMTQQLNPQKEDKVLEIGTGSGYQAAVLSPLVKEVYSIEIVEPLGRQAATDLTRLGFTNVHVRVGDGYQGWPEAAPFDKIIVTCAPESIPRQLAEQLKEGGVMSIPVGPTYNQSLYMVRKRQGRLEQEQVFAVRFVPMTGRKDPH